MNETLDDSDDAVSALREAIVAQRHEEAYLLVKRCHMQLTEDLVLPSAIACGCVHQWSMMYRLLNRVIDRTEEVILLRRLAKNLMALSQSCDLSIIDFSEWVEQPQWIPANNRLGQASLAKIIGEQSLEVIETDWVRYHDARVLDLKAIEDVNRSIVLLGFGNGQLLREFKQFEKLNDYGRTSSVYIIEPDLHLFISALMLDDFAKRDDILQQKHFYWYLGQNAYTDLYEQLKQNPARMPPINIISNLPERPNDFDAMTRSVTHYIKDRSMELKLLPGKLASLNSMYEAPDLYEVFKGNANEPLRVMVGTTRYTTVMQYVARDFADAFRKIGAEVLFLIEEKLDEIIQGNVIAERLLSFKPHLYFQVNHARFEMPDAFPPSMPMVVLIQDMMKKLNTPEAGPKVTDRDFFVTSQSFRFTTEYGYPASQIIDLGVEHFGRSPNQAPQRDAELADIVFMTNASAIPEEMLIKCIASMENDRPIYNLALMIGQRMMQHYQEDNAYFSLHEIVNLIKQCAQVLELQITTDLIDKMKYWYWDTFNNHLMRQQTLRWLVKCAGELGLSLGLYGKGWEEHPEFASHAMGYAVSGPQTEQIMFNAKYNIHTSLYANIHVRFLDGYMLPAFFLMRSHPGIKANQDVRSWLAQKDEPHTLTMKDAHDVLMPTQSERWRLWEWTQLSLNSCVAGNVDCPDFIHYNYEKSHWPTIPPEYEKISFSSYEELKRRILFYENNPLIKTELLKKQQHWAEENWSYDSAAKQIIDRITENLAKEKTV